MTGYLFVFAVILMNLYLWMKLLERLGLNIWKAILFLIPVVNVVFFFMLISDIWPIEEKLKYYQEKYGPVPTDFFEANKDKLEEEIITCPKCGAKNIKNNLKCSFCETNLQ